MGKIKKLLKDVEEIKSTINDLRKEMDTGVISRAKRCVFLDENLKNIKFDKVKYTRYVDDLGNFRLRINYEIISEIVVDMDGELNVSPTIKSINLLDLLSNQELNKMYLEIEKLKKSEI